MTDITLAGYFLLAAVLATDLLGSAVVWLNVRFAQSMCRRPPAPLLQFVDPTQLNRAVEYLTATTKTRLAAKAGHMAVVYALFLSGLLVWSVNALAATDYPDSLKAVALLFPFSVASMIAGLPGTLYRAFRVEKRFDLGRPTLRLFLLDRLRMLVISFAATFVVLTVLFAIMQVFPHWWWVLGAAFFCLFIASLHVVYPTFIAPLFNRYRPLPDGDLRRRLLDLVARAGLPLDNIFVVDASRRSTRQNASFSGFGRSRRIVLYDTLMDNSSPELIEAILAHEIGHCRCNHIARTLVVSVPIVFIVFFAVGLLLNWNGLYSAFGLPHATFAGIFLISVLAAPVRLLFGAASSWMSRNHEYEADAFASRILRSPGQLIAALVEMNRHNLGNPIPHPLYTVFFGSHPTLPQRIHNAAMRQFREAGSNAAQPTVERGA